MGLIGQVVKMDVDADDKASGVFLHARIAIELDKPIRRGVLLRMSKNEEPRWFPMREAAILLLCLWHDGAFKDGVRNPGCA
jgi:hypothetical protein